MDKIPENTSNNDLAIEIKSNALSDLALTICVGGGIAAIEVPKVARELRRLGARVKIYATEAALKFVGKDALEWSTSEEVTVHSSGLAEHISQEDAVLVFPATTDLIGKAANGICPDACSTYIQSALGRQIPVVFLPTMHDSLRNSPAFEENFAKLRTFSGVSFIEPRVEEGKWKAPSPENIALELSYRINSQRLSKMLQIAPKALVTLGGTASKIDIARTLTNLSTGTMGAILIRRLLESGVETVALCGNHSAKIAHCSGLQEINSVEFDDMKRNLEKVCADTKFDGFFHIAAVSDFGSTMTVVNKISSSQAELNLKLKKLPKLISLPCLSRIFFKAACKFTSSNSSEDFEKAERLLRDNKLHAVLWNWGESAFGIAAHTQESVLFSLDGSRRTLESKEQAASVLVEQFILNLKDTIPQK